MEKISVVLASYNGEAYIEQQLDSLRNQTLSIHEVIIFDDQSSDMTASIVKNYIERYQLPWMLYEQKQNVGYIKNFSSALQKATGDILFLCDQDDIWELHKIEVMVKLFQEHPNITCINSSFTYINAKNEGIHQIQGYNNYGMLWSDVKEGLCVSIPFEEIIFHNISMGCTMAFRSKIKDVYVKYSTYCAPHDWEINRIAAIHDGLYFYQAPLIRYRIHDTNTVGNDNVNGRSHEKRVKNAQTMASFSESAVPYFDLLSTQQQKRCAQLQELCAKRFELLYENKKKNWVYLLRHKAMYHKIISYKGMLADVLNK